MLLSSKQMYKYLTILMTFLVGFIERILVSSLNFLFRDTLKNIASTCTVLFVIHTGDFILVDCRHLHSEDSIIQNIPKRSDVYKRQGSGRPPVNTPLRLEINLPLKRGETERERK